MKYKIKLNLTRTAILAAFWYAFNYRIISFTQKLSGFGRGSRAFYAVNNDFIDGEQTLGVVMTVLYIVFAYLFLKRELIESVVRTGRDRFIKSTMTNVMADAVIFALEYCAVNLVACLIFIKFDVLLHYNLFIFHITLFFAAAVYFSFVGFITVLLRTVFNFKSFYMYASIFVFLILYSLREIMVFIQPSNIFSYINTWLVSGQFDLATYFVNMLMVIICSVICFIINRLVIAKKDIITNEK